MKDCSEISSAININQDNKNKTLLPNSNRYYIGTWDESPEFLRDNEYIKNGYRINFNTIPRIFRSLFMCHNESTNIWSHIFGIVLFSVFIIYINAILDHTKIGNENIMDKNFTVMNQSKREFTSTLKDFFSESLTITGIDINDNVSDVQNENINESQNESQNEYESEDEDGNKIFILSPKMTICKFIYKYRAAYCAYVLCDSLLWVQFFVPFDDCS